MEISVGLFGCTQLVFLSLIGRVVVEKNYILLNIDFPNLTSALWCHFYEGRVHRFCCVFHLHCLFLSLCILQVLYNFLRGRNDNKLSLVNWKVRVEIPGDK